MKQPSDPHPALLCRMVRGWSALAGDPAHGAPARHVAGCASCRAYFAAAGALDSRLRRAASSQLKPLPGGFEHRMDRALAPVLRGHRASNSGSVRRVTWATVAAVAIAVVFIQLRPHEPDPVVVEAEADPQTMLNESVAIAQTLNDRFWNSLAPAATTFAGDNALHQEIGAVYTDARSALQFLALNFLPTPEEQNEFLTSPTSEVTAESTG